MGGGAITIILNIIALKVVNIVDVESFKKFVYILLIVPFGLALLNYLISAIYKRALWRLIPCFNRPSSPVFLTQLIKHLITFLLTFAYSLAVLLQPPSTNSTFLILHYRAFNRLFHSPLAASLESAVLLLYLLATDPGQLPRTPYDNAFLALFIIHLALHRLMLLFNKSLYVLTSVMTAYKNKKQRFASQTACFVVQFTIGMPIFLMVLVFTTVFNTATVPYMGFAYFVIGYPKPQRGWSQIAPQVANPSDERSDGHLYQAMIAKMEVEL